MGRGLGLSGVWVLAGFGLVAVGLGLRFIHVHYAKRILSDTCDGVCDLSHFTSVQFIASASREGGLAAWGAVRLLAIVSVDGLDGE